MGINAAPQYIVTIIIIIIIIPAIKCNNYDNKSNNNGYVMKW